MHLNLRQDIVVAFMLLLVPTAWADWSDDADAPLVLGTVHGLIMTDYAMTTGSDGATWVAWIDMHCASALRVQRIGPDGRLLVPGGLVVSPVTACEGREPRLAACDDGSVVATGVGFPLNAFPVHRFAADGTSMWGDGITVSPATDGLVGRMLGVSNGEALVAWSEGLAISVNRYRADGSAVWSEPAAFTTIHGLSKYILALVTDGADGAFVVWSTPDSYTRRIWVMRFTAGGQPAWPSVVEVLPTPPGSSRHTRPVVTADGAGGVVIIWTVGSDGPGSLTPLLMQRLAADGTKLLDPQGHRISLDGTRQYDPVVARDDASGDLFVAWRDGSLEQSLRAQRLSPAGARLWGDTGVHVTPIGMELASRFDGAWTGTMLALAVTDTSLPEGEPTVRVHRVDGSGAVAPDPWAAAGPAPPATIVHTRGIAGALAVSWLRDEPSFDDHVVAHRINEDGTIGGPPLPGDVNGDGSVDVDDLIAVILGWGPCAPPPAECPADLDGSGAVGVDDLVMVIVSWS